MIIKPTKQLKQSNNLTSAPSFQVSISHLSELQGRNVCLWWPFDLSPKQRHTLLKKTRPSHHTIAPPNACRHSSPGYAPPCKIQGVGWISIKTRLSRMAKDSKLSKSKRFLRLAFRSFTFLFVKRHLETDQSTADLHPHRTNFGR